MKGFWRASRGVLVVLLALATAVPVPAWGEPLSLGTARGVRGVEASLDGGRTWLPLGARSLPVLDGTQVRSTTGGALVDLVDGSRVNLLPFSAMSVQRGRQATDVMLLHGRLTFRLPQQTRVELRTASARLEPVRTQAMAGEVIAGGAGLTALKMTRGSLRVQELGGEGRVRLASLEPVFLPRRPPGPLPPFTVDAPAGADAGAPRGARAVFTPRGESIGYLGPDATLVVHPGYTADLTQPFPPRLVQMAMARVPERDRGEALPVFDVNGGYTGYLSGSVFFAQAQVAQAVGTPPPPVDSGVSGTVVAGIILGAGVLGVGIAAAAGLFGGGDGNGSQQAATQTNP